MKRRVMNKDKNHLKEYEIYYEIAGLATERIQAKNLKEAEIEAERIFRQRDHKCAVLQDWFIKSIATVDEQE